MKRDIYGIQKEYILIHEVLKTLRKFGYTIATNGIEEKGKSIIYQYNLNSSVLELGVLCALLNEADIVNPKDKPFDYVSKLDVRIEDILIKKYKIEEIVKATDTLESASEVYFSSTGDFKEGTFKKFIHLGKDGLYSFNTNKYLKLFKEDRDKEIIQKSTLNTNLWMKVFTGGVAFSAIAALIIQLPTCKSNRGLCHRGKWQSMYQIHKKRNEERDFLFQGYSKEGKVNLKTDSTLDK